MMRDLSELYGRMRSLAEAEDPAARSLLIRNMTDMLTVMDERPNAREWELVRDIYDMLVEDVEHVVRAQFAQQLATRPDAPRDLIKTLGNDEIEIARPVLLNSRVLLDEDLIEIVEQKGSDHRVAVAQRPDLPETVSEIIVHTGDIEPLKTLLKNESARISEPAFMKISDYCASTRDLHEPLVLRKDTPWKSVEKIVGLVSDALLNTISEKWDLPMADLVMMVYRARDASAKQLEEQRRQLHGDDAVSETGDEGAASVRVDHQIIQALSQGDLKMAQRLLEHWTDLKESIVQTILMQDDLRLLATVYKAKGTDQLTFSRTIFALRGLTNNAEAEDLRKVLRIYRNLDRERAVALLNLWREEPKLFQRLLKTS